MLGTFYRSPKPGDAPFVAVGSEVEEETVVAIIEVMKLMNTVRAGVRGTVAQRYCLPTGRWWSMARSSCGCRASG